MALVVALVPHGRMDSLNCFASQISMAGKALSNIFGKASLSPPGHPELLHSG